MDQVRLHREYTYAMLLYVVGFAISITIISALLSDLVEAFSIPPRLEGTMSTTASVGSLLSLVAMLFLQGRVRKDKILVAAAGMVVLMLVCKGLAPSYPALLACFFVFGIAVGFIDGNCNAFIVDLNGADSGKYLGALHAFSGLGALFAPLFIQWVRGLLPWRTTYFVLAAVVAVPYGIFALTGLSMNRRLSREGNTEARLTPRDVKEYLTNRENLVILAALFLFTCSFNGLIVWVIRYMKVVLHDSVRGAYALAAYWIFAALSRFFAPRLKLSPRKIFLIGTPVGAVILLAGLAARSPSAIIACCALDGLVSGHGVPTLITMGCARYQERSSLPSSLLVIMMYLAFAAMPAAMAAVAASSSLQYSMYLSAVCAIAAALVGLLLPKRSEG